MGNPRRGFPTEKQSTGLFFAPPALFMGKDFAACGLRWGRRPSTPNPFVCFADISPDRGITL